MTRSLLAVLVALSLTAAACASNPDPGSSSSSSGSSSSSSGSSSSGSSGQQQPSTPTLVGDWLFSLPIGRDEIIMSSTTYGVAQLYWYDGGQAKWQVSAVDDGAGSATLTLSCTSANCADSDDIVYDCTYSLIELKCTGLSGGPTNSYKGNKEEFTKQ